MESGVATASALSPVNPVKYRIFGSADTINASTFNSRNGTAPGTAALTVPAAAFRWSGVLPDRDGPAQLPRADRPCGYAASACLSRSSPEHLRPARPALRASAYSAPAKDASGTANLFG